MRLLNFNDISRFKRKLNNVLKKVWKTYRKPESYMQLSSIMVIILVLQYKIKKVKLQNTSKNQI